MIIFISIWPSSQFYPLTDMVTGWMPKIWYFKGGFKQAVPDNQQPEHGATQFNGIAQGRSGDIFNDIRYACGNEQFAGRVNQIGITPVFRQRYICLAGRAGCNGIKLRDVYRKPCHNIGLNKREGIVSLRLDVNADHIKSGAVITGRGTARFAEEVEEEGPFHLASLA